MFIINMIQHHWSGHLTQKIHDNAMTKLPWLLMFQCARLFVLFLHLFHCLQIQLVATHLGEYNSACTWLIWLCREGNPNSWTKWRFGVCPWTPSLNGLQGTNGRCEPQCPMTSVTWRKAIRAWLRLLNLNRNYSYSKSRFYCILLHYHLWIHS